MNFIIALNSYFQSVGFSTDGWRKSVDGTKAIVHDKYAKVLIEIENNENIQVYSCPSAELDIILNSSEWAIEEI